MNLPGIPVVAAYRSRASAASCVGVTAPVRTTARTRSEYMYVCAWYGRERSNESVNIYLTVKQHGRISTRIEIYRKFANKRDALDSYTANRLRR